LSNFSVLKNKSVRFLPYFLGSTILLMYRGAGNTGAGYYAFDLTNGCTNRTTFNFCC